MRQQIGHYEIAGPLGEGGMGVVYRARDRRLGRDIALKMIRPEAVGPLARERFWREARAAAGAGHPAVCQIFEIGEDGGDLFIAMELLGGLDALHRRGLVHRDLKPANIFLTPHGVKLLDFGLARAIGVDAAEAPTVTVTMPGTIVGTPRYLAPEILFGREADARADLFAAGAVLFEMLTANPPFAGATLAELVHAVAYEHPPVLAGSAAVAGVDRVIHRALAKNAADRYQTADAMAVELRAALSLADSGDMLRVGAMTRLIVLPFRLLRPDAEIEFLSFSLADAISTSLSGLESLAVRSSHAAARFSAGPPDLKAVAAETDVDIVLLGTLLRSGGEVRVTSQLIEAHQGTVVWSDTAQVPLGDIFQLQDSLARRIVDSLALPLSAREHRTLKHDVPANAKAYEFYLRANDLAFDPPSWTVARDLYLRCLEEDPQYAPAWARLGRIYRVLAKYGVAEEEENLRRAEGAFTRALAINSDLTIAHNLYAHLEVDLGRARDAMLRLVERARLRTADAELFAGLLHACRYCGLLDASVAAHQHAVRLDPRIPTSVAHTFFMLGEYERVAAADAEGPYLRSLALMMLGRGADARAALEAASGPVQPLFQEFLASVHALADGRPDASIEALGRIRARNFKDPEGLFYTARQLAYLGEQEDALNALARATQTGFHCYPALARDPWLDPLRGSPRFVAILRYCEARHRETRAAFVVAGGDKVLGLAAAV